MSTPIYKGTYCELFFPYIYDGTWYLRRRQVNYETANKVLFGNASLNNSHVIPLSIIGYKKDYYN